MKRENKGIRPQDILVLSKLISLKSPYERQQELAFELGLSQAEIANSLSRLKRSGLVDESKKHVNKLAAMEFFKHVLKFLFPVEYGGPARGFATGPSLDFIEKEVRHQIDLPYVIESGSGEEFGISVLPIYPSVSKVILENDSMRKILGLVDILRGLGGVRHRKVAEAEISKIIFQGSEA